MRFTVNSRKNLRYLSDLWLVRMHLCGMYASKHRRKEITMNKNDIPEIISIYTQDQAIEDGVLVLVGRLGEQRIVFTSNLFYDGYEDKERRIALLKKGLELLKEDDPEDAPYMRLRVIEKDKIWVIWNAEGFTFMKPEDY